MSRFISSLFTDLFLGILLSNVNSRQGLIYIIKLGVILLYINIVIYKHNLCFAGIILAPFFFFFQDIEISLISLVNSIYLQWLHRHLFHPLGSNELIQYLYVADRHVDISDINNP